MTPKEALDRLRVEPGDGRAWAAVDAELARLVTRVTDDPGLRRDAVESVRRKLEDQALDGDLDPIAAPAAYLSKALRWRVIDLVRRRERALRAHEKLALRAEAERLEQLRNAPLAGEMLTLLEQVVERAVARRDAWQRDHLRHAWAQIRALHVEGRTLREIVAADAPDEEVELAVQRAHKAHQRARAAFAEALEDLVRIGRIDVEAAGELRATLGRLRRRQERAAPSVSGPREGT